jgi:hypothetical protein
VGSVDISLRSGRGTIRDVRVENPDGFADEDAVQLGDITLDLDVGSLNRDPIIIEEIRVRAPVVNAEVDEKLLANVVVIRDHVQKYQASAPRPAKKQDAGYEKHFRHPARSWWKRESSGRRHPGRRARFELPPIELTNVGGSRECAARGHRQGNFAALFARITQVVGNEMKGDRHGKDQNMRGRSRSMTRPIHVGQIPFLNCILFFHALEERADVRLSPLVPSALPRRRGCRTGPAGRHLGHRGPLRSASMISHLHHRPRPQRCASLDGPVRTGSRARRSVSPAELDLGPVAEGDARAVARAAARFVPVDHGMTRIS